MYKASLFCVLVCLTRAAVATPRLDIYKKVEKRTSVSLRVAYMAAGKGQRLGRNKLAIYGKKIGLNSLKSAFSREVSRQQKECRRAAGPALPCQEKLEDLKRHLSSIEALDLIKSDDWKKILFRNLLIWRQDLKENVLKSEYQAWEGQCPPPKGINTLACKKIFYEINIIDKIARDIVTLAAQSSRGRGPAKKYEDLERLIRRYE